MLSREKQKVSPQFISPGLNTIKPGIPKYFGRERKKSEAVNYSQNIKSKYGGYYD